MRSALAKAWNALSSALVRLPGQARNLVIALATQRIARRRLAVVVAAAFVWCYALAVLGYVLVTPEIGIRCAFTLIVSHFDNEFLYRGQDPLRDDDVIVQVGNRRVANWSQLMRKIADLNHEPTGLALM